MRTLVLGGGGHTGRFVVDDLERRGLQVTAPGRAQLELPDVRRLSEHLTDVDVVVNCAGPFADTALDVVRAAATAGVAYLDVNAEQAVTRSIIEVMRDARPRTAVVPSAAFFGGLGDLVATAAAQDWTEVDSVDLVIGLDSWHPTEGTRKTGARNSGRRLTFQGGRLSPAGTSPQSRSWDYGGALGVQTVAEMYTADQVTIPSHLSTRAVTVFVNERPMRDLDDPSTPPPVLTAEGRSDQRFSVTAVVRRAGAARTLTATGQDIYAVSAPIVGGTIEALAAAGMPAGVHTIGTLTDPLDFLRRLEPHGVRIEASKAPLEGLPQR